MNLEQLLTDELRDVAGAAQAPPPPDVAALVGAAERVHRRSLANRIVATGLVAAAIVVAIVVGMQIGRPTAEPLPTKPTPSYYASGVPYVEKGTLYIDHEPQPGEWVSAETVGANTVARRVDAPGISAVVLRDGVEVFTTPNVYDGPMLSPRGSTIAWIEKSDGTGTLIVRDLTADRELRRIRLELPVRDNGNNSAQIDAVLDDGTVYYSAGSGTWTWRPGATPKKETPDYPEPATPPGFPDGANVRLSPDHLWGAWLTDPTGRIVPGSDAQEPPVRDGLTVQKPGVPESRFTIPLPVGTRATFLTWESPTKVWVNADPARGTQVCDVVTHRCIDATAS